MTNDILQEIDRLHTECSKMDKVSRISYLLGWRKRLFSMADQMATYVACKGSRMTPNERALAQNLLEMIDAVNEEGRRTSSKLVCWRSKQWGRRYIRDREIHSELLFSSY